MNEPRIPPAEPKDRIPGVFLRSLHELRTALERDGSIQRRPNGCYRLRYRIYDEEKGYYIHRSMGLGHEPEMADAVAALISKWRAEGAEARRNAQLEVEAAQRLEKLTAAQRDFEHRLAALGAGGGRDQQRATLQELRTALDSGPAEGLRYVMSLHEKRPKRAVRPRKMRLW